MFGLYRMMIAPADLGWVARYTADRWAARSGRLSGLDKVVRMAVIQ